MSATQSNAVLPAWSYSMIDSFEQCPRKAYHRYILKEKEPETEALRHGNAVHRALEARVKGIPLPEAFIRYSPMAESVINAYRKGMRVFTELKMGITLDMAPCEFFGKTVWGRCAADVLLESEDRMWVGDWKTGKKRDKALQLTITALFIFKHFPKINQITACNLWLEEGAVGTPYTFIREHEHAMWRDIIVRIQAMERALASMHWPEQPSGLCGWCPVKTCQYNKT